MRAVTDAHKNLSAGAGLSRAGKSNAWLFPIKHSMYLREENMKIHLRIEFIFCQKSITTNIEGLSTIIDFPLLIRSK